MRTIDLVEGDKNYLPADALTTEQALEVLQSATASLEFPSPINGYRFVLEPTNIVGLIPLSGQTMIRITPKTPIANLFGMMEQVYELPSLEFYDGIGRVEAIEDIYSRLANLLAQRVLHRLRQGLYASYQVEEEVSPVLRGRIDIDRSLQLQARGSVGMHCVHESLTVDNEENRILLWALDRIPRLGLPVEQAITLIHSARRALMRSVMLSEISPEACRDRSYNRLNSDYAILHALSRFFLDRMGPGLSGGDHEFLPFKVNVASLFQEYVVACLRRYAPEQYSVTRQYAAAATGDFAFEFKMDVAITDSRTGEVVTIVDAKYKKGSRPVAQDVEQVIAYATHVGARHAFLAYPIELEPAKLYVGPEQKLQVAMLGLALDRDLESAARRFTETLFSLSAEPARVDWRGEHADSGEAIDNVYPKSQER